MGSAGKYFADSHSKTTTLGAAGGERDDSYQGDPPPNLKILAVSTNSEGPSQMTYYYRKPSGALHRKGFVFSVGSLSFVGSLLSDTQLQALVKNVLAECGVSIAT